jgi:ComF family protein
MACRVAPRDFDEAWPLFDFRGTAGALIAAFKFGRRPALAAFFAELLLPVIAAKWTEWTVVPVPPRREVLTSRGWDQVELLARQLEKRGRPVARVLERLPSLEQKTLGLEDRKANAAKAYRMRRDVAAPRKALLVDDVYTTGATADACARALSHSGSERVAFVAIAAD